MHVRLEIQALSAITTRSAHEQSLLRNGFLQLLAQQQQGLIDSVDQSYSQVDQRIGRVEQMLKVQSAQIESSQLTQMGVLYSSLPPPYRRRRSRPEIERSRSRSPARSEGVSICVSQYVSSTCRSDCLCACHLRSKKSATSGFLDSMLGQLFVGYAGIPLLSPRCDSDSCEKAQTPHVSVEYWFPLGFCWSQIVRLQLGYQPNVGPCLQLSTLRRVPDSAQCVNYALEGNIEGLKQLFKNGLASPRDVSSTRGYSILRVCHLIIIS
jgi:hypothetical protein